MQDTMRLTRLFFWFAFIVFLSTSIPHVAWTFHEYEGTGTPALSLWGLMIDIWWVLSYLMAISIDALVAWLSFLLSMGKQKGEIGFMWAAIALLSLFSWFLNWIYAMSHDPASRVNVWGIHILMGITTVGYITPVLVSALPVFTVGYAFMVSRLARANMTAHELEERVNELEALATQKARLAALSKGSVTSRIKAGISSLVDVASFTKESISPLIASSHAPSHGYVHEQGGDIPTDTHTDTRGDITSDSLEDITGTREKTRRPLYLSLNEAVTESGYSREYLQKVIQRGRIRTHKNDKTRLLVSSFEDYLTSMGRERIEREDARPLTLVV